MTGRFETRNQDRENGQLLLMEYNFIKKTGPGIIICMKFVMNCVDTVNNKGSNSGVIRIQASKVINVFNTLARKLDKE